MRWAGRILSAALMVAAGCGPLVDRSAPATTPEPTRDITPPATEPPRPTPDPTPPDPDPTPMVTPTLPDALRWAPCNRFTGTDEETPTAVCATFQAPVRWGGPENDTIPIFVKQHPSRRPQGQVWLLQGGPGGSGVGMEQISELLQAQWPGAEVYIPDHRGTGRSTPLECGGALWSLEDWARCGEALEARWGSGLAGFTPTDAAQDLIALIELTRRPEMPVYIYGGSYGTYWAHRALQLDPEIADAVVLDSMCPPELCSLANYDHNFNEIGRDFMSRCAAAPACNAHLGEDPWGRLGELFEAIDTGRCTLAAELGIDRRGLRQAFSSLLMDLHLRELIAPIAHRLLRCEAQDEAAIRSLADFIVFEDGSPQPGDNGESIDFSPALNQHIVLSELWGTPPPTQAALQTVVDEAFISPDTGPFSAALRPSWPLYPEDPLASRWAQTRVPMLILQGGLDPQTPPAFGRAAEAQFDGEGQFYVEVDDAPHGVIVTAQSWDGDLCGMEMVTSFLRSSAHAPDIGCLVEIEDVDFEDLDWLAQALFGIEQAWVGGGTLKRSPQEQRAAFEALRRRRAPGPY